MSWEKETIIYSLNIEKNQYSARNFRFYSIKHNEYEGQLYCLIAEEAPLDLCVTAKQWWSGWGGDCNVIDYCIILTSGI